MPTKGTEEPKTDQTADIKKPQSKGMHTCCLIGIVALAIVLFLLIGLVIAGVVLWKTYGNQMITTIQQSITSSLTRENEEKMREVFQEMIPSVSPSMIQVPTGIVLITPAPIYELPPVETSGQMLPDSNSRNITRSDLSGLTPWELKVARNEIYARHGRPFVSKDLSCYFKSTMWYGEDPSYTDSRLSSLETRNATFILNYEKESGSQIWNVDTGCR